MARGRGTAGVEHAWGGCLLEREGELEVLHRAVAAAASAEAAAVCVRGAAGVGKTSLLRAARAAAADQGVRVMSARGTQLERGFDYGVVRQLLEPAMRGLRGARRTRVLAGVGSGAQAALGVGETELSGTEAATIDGLYRVLANLSLQGPLLVVVDDLHWSDEASLKWLQYLLGRLDGLRLAFVAAARPAEHDTIAGLDQLIAAEGMSALALRALSEAASAELVRRRLAGDAGQGFCRRCHEVAGGNPFLLEELTRELAEAGVVPTDDALDWLSGIGPESIARAVLLRLRRLGEDAVELARAAAVLVSGATLARAAAVAGVELAAAERVADQMIGAEILTGLRPLEFVHPVVRSAIYEELMPAARARAHRRAAYRLLRDGAPLTDAAIHLLASEPAAEQWAVDALRRASEHAIAVGAPARAAQYLRRAVAEPPREEQLADVLLELGRAEARAGEQEASEHLEQARAAAGSPVGRARAGLELSHALTISGQPRRALEVIVESIGELGHEDRELTAALGAAAVLVSRLDLALARELELLMPRLTAAATAETLPGRLLLASLAHRDVTAVRPAPEAIRRLDAAGVGELVWSEQTNPAIYLGVWSLIVCDELDQATGAIERLEREPSVRGFPIAPAILALLRGLTLVRRGALRDAEAQLRRQVELTRALGTPQAGIYALAVLTMTLTELGECSQAAEELVASGLPEDAIAAQFMLRGARGILRATTGEHEAAIEDLLVAGEQLQAGGQDNPSYLNWRSLAARPLRALGRVGEAEALVAEELDLARRFGTPRPIGIALRAAGHLSQNSRGIELLRESVQLLENAPAPLELARSRIELGAALRRNNRRTEAQQLLRDGLDTAARCAAQPLIEQATDELRATGARPRRIIQTGVDSLTASEHRVARLAAQGLTNRGIAEQLSITVKTVEDHLTASYQKLNITSRKKLAHALSSIEH